MKASSLSFRAAVLLVIAGMVWGIVMAISENHQTMPAHAHLNLLGWVSLFLFGIFYHLHPAIDRSRAALFQASIWMTKVKGCGGDSAGRAALGGEVGATQTGASTNC